MERDFSINQSGYSIRCKLHCQDPRAVEQVVLFVHGFGGHKGSGAELRLAQKLLAKYKGAALVSFDLPAHGEDAHKRLELSVCLEYLDIVAAYLQEKYPGPLSVCATSFGGYLVLLYLRRRGNPFRRIALRCPAVCIYESLTRVLLTGEQLAQLEKGKPVLAGFDRKVQIDRDFLAELRENDVRREDYLDWAEDILLVQGTRDEIIPPEEVARFADDQLIELVPIEGADHRFRDPRKMDLAIREILEFLMQKDRMARDL